MAAEASVPSPGLPPAALPGPGTALAPGLEGLESLTGPWRAAPSGSDPVRKVQSMACVCCCPAHSLTAGLTAGPLLSELKSLSRQESSVFIAAETISNSPNCYGWGKRERAQRNIQHGTHFKQPAPLGVSEQLTQRTRAALRGATATRTGTLTPVPPVPRVRQDGSVSPQRDTAKSS